MSMAGIAVEVGATGLGIVGWFHPRPEDGAPPGTGTLLLLGPSDGAMWALFSASSEFRDGLPDPLDRWSRRVIDGLAARLGAGALYPFGGPPWHPFQRWATLGEAAVVSPVAMQASPTRGLWMSYRGALAFAGRLRLPPRQSADPCHACPAPCTTACPVDAFAGGAYDVPRCVAHVTGPAGADCRRGCLVRAACPAGAGTVPPVEQRAFHMAAFLAAQGGSVARQTARPLHPQRDAEAQEASRKGDGPPAIADAAARHHSTRLVANPHASARSANIAGSRSSCRTGAVMHLLSIRRALRHSLSGSGA